MIRRLPPVGAAALALVLVSGCSDDNPLDEGPPQGSVSFDVAGEVQGAKSGIADFHYMDHGSLHTWGFTFNDFGPQTFNLTLTLQSFDPIDRPGPGTYPIGWEGNDPSVFFGIYVDTEAGVTQGVEYDTFEGSGGTLTITESTPEVVSGTFEFTAHDWDQETQQSQGQVTVTGGEFTAHRREGG